MTYTKEQVLEYLNEQNSLQGAINNFGNIGSDRPRIVDSHNGKVYFYLEEDITTKVQVKNRIVKYMKSQACEVSGNEEFMTLAELLEYCEMALIK